MTPCRRACLTSSIFNQFCSIYRLGTPISVTVSQITTPPTPPRLILIPAPPSKDRFGSSATKTASKPVLDAQTRQIATYKCRVSANAKPTDQTVADANMARCEWRIYLPLAADIRVEDRIKVGDFVYEVVDTDRGRADASFLTAYCRSEK